MKKDYKAIGSITWSAIVLTVGQMELRAEGALNYDAAAISKAMEGIQKAVPIAKADPSRPVYHMMPEAQWMNDPNGAFFANGWFHLFYQSNPYDAGWGHMHWGHARSRDNVIWERLPVAVWPTTEKGEDHCYSGSTVQDGNGNWQLWYASVSQVREKDKDKGPLDMVFNGQVMLKPMDKDFIKWGKTTEDPANKPTLPSTRDGYVWKSYLRDPSFFSAGGRTFMILGASGAGAPIYEALNKELTQWKHRGSMCDMNFDCPQMIPLGAKWLYALNRGEYCVGTFDPQTAKFTKETGGRLDQGDSYAHISHSTDSKGRHITYSWLQDTREAKGWNCCIALPRVISLGDDGQPVQMPVPELSKLHGTQESVTTSAGTKVLKTSGDTLEIRALFQQADKGKCGLRVRRSEDGSRALAITYDGGTLDVFGTKVTIAPLGEGKTLSLQVFLDKSIMEVFINGGKKTVVRVLYPPLADKGVEVFSDGKSTTDVWPMKSIWP